MVPNVERQEEERDPNRHLGRTLTGGGREKYRAVVSTIGNGAVPGGGEGGGGRGGLAWA